MNDCIFCKIINKDLPAKIVYEDGEVMVFETNQPLAPVHVLIVPKRHIVSVDDLADADLELVGKLILTARDIARDLNISEKGYKLMFHVGEHGGQEVPHLHLHLMGGAKMEQEIKIIKD
jgi:histidine triad (HIT) family protein